LNIYTPRLLELYIYFKNWSAGLGAGPMPLKKLYIWQNIMVGSFFLLYLLES